MMGSEIVNRNMLRAFIADLDAFRQWTGLSDSGQVLTRIRKTEMAANQQLPACVIAFGESERANRYGSDSSSNFRPAGALLVTFFEAVRTDNSFEQDEDRFGGSVTDIIDEMAERSDESGCHFSRIRMFENPFRVDAVNTEHVVPDGEDVDQVVTGVWSASIVVEWGIR